MKKFLFIFLFLPALLLHSQILELTSQGRIFTVQISPTEYGVVAKINGQWKLINSEMETLVTFSLNAPSNLNIYGCAQDFDDDDNYEVFYWYYDENYHYTTILKDITTGETQIELSGNSQYSYMPYYAPFYMNNQRYFTINKISSSDYSVVESYLYRSGVQVENSQNGIMAKTTSLNNVKNYPNPFVLHGKSPVTIEFNLTQPQNVSIDLYNIKG